MAEKKRAAEHKQALRRWHRRRLRVLLSVIGLFAVIGLLFFARPKTSALEKRSLTKRPHLTWAGVWSGSYFSELTQWYADTYPLREGMIAAQAKAETLNGLRGTAIYGDAGKVGDNIPDSSATSAAPTIAPTLTPTPVQQAESIQSASGAEQEETPLKDGAGTLHETPEVAGTVYIADHRGFELYYFSQEGVDTYAAMLNTVRAKVGADVPIYDIIVPNSFGVNLDEAVQASMNASNQGEAIAYAYGRMDPSIQTIDIYKLLRAHNSEYLYFHTDHHWTADGAWYAYQAFCEKKGITPHDRSEYDKREFKDFMGSFYAYSNQSPELAGHPDTVNAYVPLATNDEKVIGSDMGDFDYQIISDGDEMSTENKYLSFIGGDQPLVEIENPKLQDDSACVLIKESYGNCFAPFLVDHYQHVYVVDYRYYADNVTALVQRHKNTDLIFLNNVEAVGANQSQAMLGLFW